MYRDNVVADRARLLAVLDAVIAWSAAHPGLVRFRPDDNTKGIIRFEDVATNTVFWAATPRRQCSHTATAPGGGDCSRKRNDPCGHRLNSIRARRIGRAHASVSAR
jgi:hypothetical protein